MNAIGEEVATTKEHDHFCGPAACELKSVAETIALPGAHRAIVKIEGEIADPILFPICYLAERSMVGRGVDRKHGFGKTLRNRSECLRGRKLKARSAAG